MDPRAHPERHRDSDATTDLESVHFEPQQTTGPEFYNRSKLSRRVSLVGVGVAALFGACCICTGIVLLLSPNPTFTAISFGSSWRLKEFLSLVLNLIVTACTEATGSVHGISLRSALASERRLRFNTNLRLLSAASGWFNPNGRLCNIVMAILLIVSYNSSFLITLSIDLDAIDISEIPFIALGAALFLQAVIALASVRSADILTWSSSPFDITAALVHHAQILPEPGRCMHGVADERREGSVKPSAKQSSAWGAHLGVRRVLMVLWLLVVICMIWGLVIIIYIFKVPDNSMSAFKSGTWTFFPQSASPYVIYTIHLEHWYYWALYYMNMAAIQGPLTLALHCSELLVGVIRDERLWRKATTKNGTMISSHPLASVFGSPLNVALLVSKPLLHWMLGLAIDFAKVGILASGQLSVISLVMWPFQIFNYSAALLIFSLALTVVVFIRPSGPQPAAYGHIQTLANLIDEWSPTMWWGHKSPGHAGTSDVRLGKVDMNALYR